MNSRNQPAPARPALPSPEPAEGLSDAEIRDLVPLSALSESERREILRRGDLLTLPAGASLGVESADARLSHFLLEGSLELRRHAETAGRISAGDADARFALSQLRTRGASVLTLSPARILRLDMSLVSTLLMWAESTTAAGLAGGSPPEPGEREALAWLPRLLRSELFSSIPAPNLHRVFEVMEPQNVSAGETVIRQGEAGVYYYVIRRGRCEVSRAPSPGADPYRLAELAPGDSFGEEALVSESRRNATVTMLEDGELLRLTKEDFVTLIMQPTLRYVDRAEAQSIVAQGGSWLDVRLPAEHEHDGIADSLNIPLWTLRRGADELTRDRSYVLYCNAGRRSSAAAVLLSGWGFDARVLRGGLFEGDVAAWLGGEPPASDQRLHEELARADAELEDALRLKVEATAARRLFADRADHGEATETDREKARLRAQLKRLELESLAAGQTLSQAQRIKLELEASIRTEAAKAEKQRAQAEAECQRLRRGAEEKLRAEQAKIASEYERGEAALATLEASRRAAETEFEQERGRMEAALAQRIGEIEREAAELRERMAAAKEAGAQRAERIRDDHRASASAIRGDTENRLRVERERLEAEFATAVQRIESAKRRLEELETERAKADDEARGLAQRLREAAEARQAEAEAEWQAEQARLESSVNSARDKVEEARSTKARAEAERQALYEELQGLGTGDAAAEREDAADRLSRDLAAHDARVAAASGEVHAAEAAQRAAEAERESAEVSEATQLAAEEELRIRLYGEAEQWLAAENERNARDVEEARQQLERMEAARRDLVARQASERQQDSSMVSEIHSQLGDDDLDPLARALGNKAYAEHRASSAYDAQKELKQRKDAAAAALERARAHISRLRANQDKPKPEPQKK